MAKKMELAIESSQVIENLPPVDPEAKLNEWSEPLAYRELLAQTYFDVWVHNPGITRTQALVKMREAGVHLANMAAITKITTSPQFKTLQQGILSQSRARMMDHFSRGLGDVMEHQIAMASGHKVLDDDGNEVDVSPRERTTAGRTVIDAFIRFGDSFDDQHSDGAERKVVFNVNTYFSPTVDSDNDTDIVEGQVMLIEDDVKDRFTMQEQRDEDKEN